VIFTVDPGWIAVERASSMTTGFPGAFWAADDVVGDVSAPRCGIRWSDGGMMLKHAG